MPSRLDQQSKSKKMTIVVPEAWVENINAWRAKQSGLPNLSEAIRRLVDVGLKVKSGPSGSDRSKK